MKRIVPHLMIENCKEAIAYYQELFGGEVKNIQLSDGIEMFKGQEGKYIHVELHVNEQCILYLADIFSQDRTKGSDVQLALELENEAEITRLFKGLSQGGKVKMELQDTFWGAKYAVVTDPYGITWELNAPQ